MNGLDPAGILEMRHLIRAFVDEGRTVFLSSHLLDEVEKTCDDIAIVDRGRVILTEVHLLILHAAHPTKHGPAGGTTNLDHLLFVIGWLGTVASIVLGAAAGTQDVSPGVFRDLVATGRSRKALFNVRYPGTLIVFLPMLAAAFGI